jgi:hypothetical protein
MPRLPIALAVASALAFAPSSASAYTTISGPGEAAGPPRLAVASNGAAAVAWATTGDRIKLRYRAPDGTWSRVQTLVASAGARDPQLAMASDGDLIVTWVGNSSSGPAIYGRTRAADGTLGARQRLSGNYLSTTGGDPWHGVGMADDGTAIAAFSENGSPDANIRWRRRAPNGTLSSRADTTIVFLRQSSPRLVVGHDGTALLTYIGRRSSSSNPVLYVKRLPAGTSHWLYRATLSGTAAQSHEEALDASGRAYFAWREISGTRSQLSAAAQNAAGTLVRRDTLEYTGVVGVPQVAIGDNGTGMVAWRRLRAGVVHLRARHAATTGAAYGPLMTQTPEGYDVDDADVAADATGDAVLVWERTGGQRRIYARRWAVGGTPTTAVQLSPGFFPSRLPLVGAAADGDALATWLGSDGTNPRVQAAPVP